MAVAAASNCCTLASVRSHPIHIMLPIRLSASVVRSCASFSSPAKCRVFNRGRDPVIYADLQSSHGSFSTLGTRKGVLCREPAPRHKSRKCRLVNDRHLATLARGSVDDTFSTELPKSFDFSEEESIYTWWHENGYFAPKESSVGEPFVVSMPPPNVTGALHMGHAMFVTLEDIMVRHWRMRGRPTLWVPGTDHAGIATQLVVEKMLAKEGVKRTDLSREEFTERVWEWKQKYGDTITNQIRRLGASCDWGRERFTLDSQLSSAVVEAFKRLHAKGLIYRGTYMVNWSPHLQTAVSDLEVEYSEEEGKMYYFKYPVAGSESSEYLPVATTRPETLPGDTAVAVHPEDERYRHLIGRRAVVPMSGGREVPIIGDEYVERKFGTGALKITPAHDQNDYAIGQRLGLPLINLLNKDGSLNENAGQYCGMDRFEARQRLWADLEAADLALKTEPHTLRVPRSQRGGEVVEPLVSRQWFVKMAPLAAPALQAVASGSLTIIPQRFEKIYNFWLSNIKDWCISRQLWWGHRIPVWYVHRDGGDGEAGGGEEEEYVVAAGEEEALRVAQERFGKGVRVEQDPDVLDTWFSRHDILFFWVARMVMMGLELTGTLPFHTIYLHGLVRDAQGRKMSKSVGNVVDPLDSIAEFGTDALRFTLATGTTPGQDVNLSSERLGANKAFTNKLWNAAKFILQNLPDASHTDHWAQLAAAKYDTAAAMEPLALSDRWVLSRLHSVVDASCVAYEKFEFGEAGRLAYDFFWNDFADWYIEASKTRIYQNPDTAQVLRTQAVLVYTLDCVLRLLHPFMPFVTERLWQIRSIRNARAEYQVAPGQRIAATVVASVQSQPFIESERAVLIALAKLCPEDLRIGTQVPGNTDESVHLVVSEGVEAYLPQAGLIDIRKEVERLGKQEAELKKALESYIKKLSSPSFVEKAPATVVGGVRAQAAEAEEKLQILSKRAQQLEAMAAASTNS